MKTIEVSDETYERIKDQLGQERPETISQIDQLIGGKFLFRTVTYFSVGIVRSRFGKFLELREASWVADTGRFMQAIKNGTLSEVEPVGRMWINLDTVVDFFPWLHELPGDQK
jgi:hypothetical protein